MKSIGIDIGGTFAKIGLIEDNVIINETRIPTCMEMDYEKFMLQLCDIILEMKLEHSIEKVGISSCGLIDSSNGRILYSNNIAWKDKDMVEDIFHITNLPAKIANDAKCAALAEAILGSGKAYDRFCMITLGTGVGGAYIYKKKLVSGDPYSDADGILGHITLERNGRLCTCGRKGCLEAYASATGIVKTYQELTHVVVDAQKIFELAMKKEEAALETMERFKYDLGEGLASICNILRPEVIAIGGGVAKSSDLFIEDLNVYVNKQIYGGNLLPISIVPAVLGNEAGMLGAVLL